MRNSLSHSSLSSRAPSTVRGSMGRPSTTRGRTHSVLVRANLFDGFKKAVSDIADFESWAPKSSRRWRLRQPPSESEMAAAEAAARQEEESLNVLEKRKKEVGPVKAVEDDAPSVSRNSMDEEQGWTFSAPKSGGLSSVDDDSLSASLNARITAIASGSAAGSIDAELEPALTPEEFRNLVFTKFGKTHDVSIVRRDIPGKTLVALNFIWIHMEQRSFPLTEEAYMEKLGGICFLLDAWGKTKEVREWLKQPPKARAGLPLRPVVGSAVSFQLDLPQEIISEYFSRFY